jgi:uncharacterized membrane protein
MIERWFRMREANRMNVSRLLLGIGIGAALMYVLDPQQGPQRRRLALNQVRRRAQPSADAIGRWSSEEGAALVHGAQEHRAGLLGVLAGGAALAFAARAAMQRGGWSGAQGTGRAHAMEVEKSIQIAATPDQVYRLWSDYDNFPRFMSMVEEVRPLGGDRSHWVVKGPAGARVEWDAVITERTPGRLLAWRSEPGASVEHAGRVQFAPSGTGTRVTVRMSYRPPGGRLGHAIASLFGRNPGQEMDADLERMKSFVEDNRAAAGETASTAVGAGLGAGVSRVASPH